MKRYTFEPFRGDDRGHILQGYIIFDRRFEIARTKDNLIAERICKTMNDVDESDKPFMAHFHYRSYDPTSGKWST